MDALLAIFNRVPPDKVLHFSGGMLLALLGWAVTGSALAGLILATAIGAAKECWDRTKPNHTADLFDFLATTLGGAVVALFILLERL